MLNVIEEKIEAIRQVAREQTNQVCNELNALVNNLQGVDNRFSAAMAAATRKREEASQIEATAMRDHSVSLNHILDAALDIVKQLDDGGMVTAQTTSLTGKAKIRAVAGE